MNRFRSARSFTRPLAVLIMVWISCSESVAAQGCQPRFGFAEFGTSNFGQCKSPTLTSINQSRAARGSTVTVSLVGSHFVEGNTSVSVSGNGVTARNFSVRSASLVTVDLEITSSAAAGGRSIKMETPGGTSNSVTFTVTVFTDDPLTAMVTTIKALHITELRTEINAARTANGLPEFDFSDSLTAGQTATRAVHIVELRTALDEAYVAADRTPPTYTDSSLSGMVIKAVHITELRDAVLNLE